MTLDEFRSELASYRRAVDDEAKLLKSPFLVFERICVFYRKLSNSERLMADKVLAEWVLSEDEKIRFDSLALIGELSIKSAIVALDELASHLALSVEPSAPYELRKIHRIVANLIGKGDEKGDGG